MNGGSSKHNNNKYKINIIKCEGNEENTNSNYQNFLSIKTRTPKRKKSSLEAIMKKSYCIKTYKNESGTKGALILKEFHKAKSVKCDVKESDSFMENKSNTGKNSKNNSKNEEESKKLPSEIKNNINYNININNSNTKEILDLLKFTNNLYNQDGHLQKDIPTKKVDINNLGNFDKNFKSDLTKKKLFIQFGLNNIKRQSYKSTKNIPRSSKEIPNFSSYIKLKQKQRNEFFDDNKINSNQNEENINVNDDNINKDNYTSKSTHLNKSNKNKSKNKKNKKSKKKATKGTKGDSNQAKRESNSKSKNNSKTKNEIIQNINILNKPISETKKEEKDEETKIDNTNKKEDIKKNKFKFSRCLCCLNQDLNDSK